MVCNTVITSSNLVRASTFNSQHSFRIAQTVLSEAASLCYTPYVYSYVLNARAVVNQTGSVSLHRRFLQLLVHGHRNSSVHLAAVLPHRIAHALICCPVKRTLIVDPGSGQGIFADAQTSLVRLLTGLHTVMKEVRSFKSYSVFKMRQRTENKKSSPSDSANRLKGLTSVY